MRNNNQQVKIANININGYENNQRFQCNIGIEVNSIMLTETAANSRRYGEFNQAQHELDLLRIKLEKARILKELRELENK